LLPYRARTSRVRFAQQHRVKKSGEGPSWPTCRPEPKPLLPQLKPFYDFVVPLSWPVIRIACGWNLAVHGWGKVTRGPSAYVKAFADFRLRFDILGLERAGDRIRRRIALMLGLFTRFWAAAAAIEMLLITMLYWKDRLRVAEPRLRIHAAVGLRLLRHRAPRRRAVLGRPRDRQGALSTIPKSGNRFSERSCSTAQAVLNCSLASRA
jgi:hypothetical protein